MEKEKSVTVITYCEDQKGDFSPFLIENSPGNGEDAYVFRMGKESRTVFWSELQRALERVDAEVKE
jgi:hypothetical protein